MCAFLEKEIFAKPPGSTKSNCYSAVSSLLAELSGAMATYHSLTGDTLERMRPSQFHLLPAESDASSTTFNPPAVETIRWMNVLPWIPSVKRKIVECILRPHLFFAHVLSDLNALPKQEGIRRPSMSRELQGELILLGYVKQSPSHLQACCPIFSVPRPDGKRRLIWDGRKFNFCCHPPPNFQFQPWGRQLQRLLDPRVKVFMTWDMKTWFTQLTPHPDVAGYFGTRLGEGREWMVTGLPMGWSWAPSIAQFTAEGIAERLIFSQPVVFCTFVYIDNGILGLEGDVHRMQKRLEKISLKTGVIIKAGSIETGPIVTWLGVELNALLHMFRLKQSFKEKLDLMWKEVQRQEFILSVRAWYAVLSCIVFCVWVSYDPLCEISDLLSWMSAIGARIDPQEPLQWDLPLTPPREVLLVFDQAIAHYLENPWRPLPLDLRLDLPLVAIGVSDASTQWASFAFHTTTEMVVQVVPVDDSSIFELELTAMLQGQKELLQRCPPNSRFKWYCDNTAALFVLRRGYSRCRHLNSEIKELLDIRKKQQTGATLFYVESKENPVDCLTRESHALHRRSKSCALHPASMCPEFLSWISDSKTFDSERL